LTISLFYMNEDRMTEANVEKGLLFSTACRCLARRTKIAWRRARGARL